jgi:DnaK suppressor protein
MDANRARELLTRERRRVEESLARLRRQPDDELSHLDQHPADEGTELFEEERDEGIADRLEEELAAIERAEKRLEEAPTASRSRAASRSPTSGSKSFPGRNARR